MFRRLHKIENPYILFLGRIGPSKGCDQLIADFIGIRLGEIKLDLVFAGSLEMVLPDHPSIHYGGTVHGDMKADALSEALAIVACSPYDCLSIMCCEAWAAARPVLATRRSPVVARLVKESGGGAIYSNRKEFSSVLIQWVKDPSRLKKMGLLGQNYVLDRYGRSKVEESLLSVVSGSVQAAHGP